MASRNGHGPVAPAELRRFERLAYGLEGLREQPAPPGGAVIVSK